MGHEKTIKTMENLIVIASCGRVRPLEYQAPGDDPIERAHLAEASGGLIEIQQEHMGSVVTDQSGRFGRNTPVGRETGMSYGEEHNLEAELENQAIRDVAAAIGRIVAEADYPPWRLVFPQAQLPALLRNISPAARDTLTHTDAGDWTKLPLSELEKRLRLETRRRAS